MTDPSSPGPSNRSPRRFATVLFTDIVGSTGLQAELGDAEWQVLLGHHNHLVRASIDRHGGREISTAGDSFLAVFETPEEAIACALEAGEAVREKGIEIRSGIHTGEIVETEGDVGGIAVNIGARVSSVAGPGEVLVSRTVGDLVRGSDIRLQPRGTHQLKGIAGQWRLYAVEGTAHRAGIVREIRVWFDRHHAPAVSAIVAVAVAIGLAGFYAVIRDRGASFSPEAALAGEAAPGIAVLPFDVRGEGLDPWREGMVDLLTTGLDGAGGLRTISSRTVLARWGEQVVGVQAADLPTALAVARATGARYALVGSAVSIGPQVRLLLEAYEVETGEELGRASVEGDPDSILMLADRLAVEAMRVILKGEEQLPEIELVRLMSDSTAALQAFLEAEVHFRRWDINAAREAYARAIEADSMFALAHSRLARANWWERDRLRGEAIRHQALAARLSDRLPEREALVLRSLKALMWGRIDELESLREAVRLYPDDAEIWYMLGETLLHVRGAMAPIEEIEPVFERAVELDPRNAEYLVHYVNFAIRVHADPSVTIRRIEMFEQAVREEDVDLRALKIARDIAFGNPEAQAAALAQYETGSGKVRWAVGASLLHPRYRQLSPELKLAYYGTSRRLIERLEDPKISPSRRARGLYVASSLGVPVPPESLEEAIGSTAIDTVASSDEVFHAGLYAADRGRWPDHERAIAEFERRADLELTEVDSLGAWHQTRQANILRGYGLWKRTGPEEALPLLDDPNHITMHDFSLLWLGRLYQELGRFRDAERVYQTFLFMEGPLEHRELGKVYEALEEWDKALEAYEYFVEYWNDADPELQPMVEEARQAIIRLRGLRRQ